VVLPHFKITLAYDLNPATREGRKKSVKVNGFILAFLVLILSIGTAAAEIYKWVDDRGVIHFSDSGPQDISESTDEEEVSSADPAYQDNTPSRTDNPAEGLPPNFFDILDESSEEAAATEEATVEIYVTSWCGYCNAAKNFFRSRGIEFTVYDIEKDRDAARRMMAMTTQRAVPFVVINGHGIQGYSEQAYELALQN
jgi:glutaredoxin